jgi:3-oxoadipate enol-lactonase/4-carboxymuconolactone decarboxylase
LAFATIDGLRIYYRLEGAAEGPVLILAHSLGLDHGMWAPQMPDLSRYFRVLRYDVRGHGASDSPRGDCSIEQLGRDVLGLADALGIGAFAFCGLSLGGMVGQWLAARAPARITHLILANTSARTDAASMEASRRMVIEGGMSAIVDQVMQRFLSRETLAAGGPTVDSLRSVFLATDPQGSAACCAAIRDMDHLALLPEIRVPTLVISGDNDLSAPWKGHGEILARTIPNARVVHLRAAHLSNIERPRSFTSAVLEFLLTADGVDTLANGYAIRRQVLGDAHVDRAIARTTQLTADFQELITRFAWGTIWSRHGLDYRTRRLLVLAMTASLGRWEEFRLHVRTGLAGELEICDLTEVLLQAAVYAGVPVANTAFQIVQEIVKESAL